MQIFPPPIQPVPVSSLPTTPAGTNAIGSVTSLSQIEAAVAGGYAYAASVIGSPTALAGNQRLLITNPNASGKTMYFYALIVAATNAALLTASVFKNPTTGLPSTSVPAQNLLIGGGSAVGSIASDTNATALSGGTAWMNLDIGATGRNSVLVSQLAVPPNNTAGINIPFAAAVTSDLTILWYEK